PVPTVPGDPALGEVLPREPVKVDLALMDSDASLILFVEPSELRPFRWWELPFPLRHPGKYLPVCLDQLRALCPVQPPVFIPGHRSTPFVATFSASKGLTFFENPGTIELTKVPGG